MISVLSFIVFINLWICLIFVIFKCDVWYDQLDNRNDQITCAVSGKEFSSFRFVSNCHRAWQQVLPYLPLAWNYPTLGYCFDEFKCSTLKSSKYSKMTTHPPRVPWAQAWCPSPTQHRQEGIHCYPLVIPAHWWWCLLMMVMIEVVKVLIKPRMGP